MTNFTYNRDIPFSTHNPSSDQPLMQTNTNNIDSLIAVDHVSFNLNNGGFHNVMHFNNQVSDPGAVAGVGQEYTKTVSGDEQLFYESGNGVITQLTGPNAAVANTNGYTWIPGGILLQWGSQAGSSSSSIPVLFITSNINFPNNCFNVQVVASRSSSSPGSDFATVVVNGTISTTGFTIGNIGGHTVNNWFWIAIGN